MLLAVDLHKDFVDVECVAVTTMFALQSSSVYGSKFNAPKPDGPAAKRFFKRALKSVGGSPRTIVTDKLKSYGAAQREMGGAWEHDTSPYSNNRCEQSHRPTRSKERSMKLFRSMKQGQRFLNIHAAVSNLFNLGRHLTTAKNYRKFRNNSFNEWKLVVEWTFHA